MTQNHKLNPKPATQDLQRYNSETQTLNSKS